MVHKLTLGLQLITKRTGVCMPNKVGTLKEYESTIYILEEDLSAIFILQSTETSSQIYLMNYKNLQTR